MPLADQIATLHFGSIATAGAGIRELSLPSSDLGPAVGEALTLSRTRALRLTRGLLDTAADTDQAASEVGSLVGWAARAGSAERRVIADALRISGGEVLLVDRIARLPRAEARPFVADWLASGGNRRAALQWLATVGAVLREHHGARPSPGTSGAVVDWVKGAAEDVVDFLTEAVETIVDALTEAGQALADFFEDVVNWGKEQVANLVEALLEAGRTLAELVTDALEAGAAMLQKIVEALLEVGRTVANVLSEVWSQALGALADTLQALRDLGITLARILRDALTLAAEAFRKVVETLLEMGQAVLQIVEAALAAAGSVLQGTIQALLDLGRTLASIAADVVTGRISVVDGFTRALQAMGRTAGAILDAAREAARDVLRAMTQSLARIGERLGELVQWAAGAAVTFARDVVAALREMGRTVVQLVSALADRAVSVMRTLVDGLFQVGHTFAELLRSLAGVAAGLLEKFLEAAFALGATIVAFVGETMRRTYAAARGLVEAAIRAGAAIGDLLVEAAKGTYFALRRMVFAMADVVGVGDIMRALVENLESFAENIFHEVMTAIRFAGGRLTEVLAWAAEEGRAVFKAVVDAWESVRENLIDLYRWAAGLAADAAREVWAHIGRATVRFRNSVSYVLNYLENDFIPGVRTFVEGLLDAGYEVAALVVRVARRSVAFVVEAVGALLDAGVTVGTLLVATVRNPRAALDNVLEALRTLDAAWRDILQAARDAGDDIVDEVIATARRLEEPLERMLAGALEVGGGFFGLVVSKLFNLLASYRPLTPPEKELTTEIFGASLDPDEIFISRESLDNDIIFAVQGIFSSSPNSRAFVTGTLINMNVNQPLTPAVLVHELTHVWQNLVTGPMYLSEAIHAQSAWGDGYNYGYTNPENGDGGETALVAAGGDFEVFNREQQGDIVMHYYVRKYEEARPAADLAPWEPYIDVVRAA